MKGAVLLFDEADGLRRAALVVDGRLESLEIDALDDTSPRIGSVYRAKLETRLPSLGAAFVDLDGAQGFLPDAGDAQPGDMLLVEVRREADGHKAARVSLTTEHTGTVTGSSGLIMEGPNAFGRLLARNDTGEREASPAAADAILDARKTDDPFDHHDVESQIDALLESVVPLADGAWMTIEPTGALVAVDVNTGASRGGDAMLRANLAAAEALPRQLRLRRLGGSIAVDFAGGPKGKARRRVEERLSDTDLALLGWGPAGWLECRRRKPGRSLADLLRNR